METVTRFADRHAGAVPAVPTPGPDVTRTLSAIATYLLSEAGRKASLLAGGDGRAVQQLTLQVPANRLHLVSVDRQGVARLKLRPRFEVDNERGVVRIDAAPIYDAPPTNEELYRAAARNHELEGAYYAARAAERTKRRESDRELRQRVAEAFLGDKAQRAVPHPPPSPKRCYVVTERGRLLFDVATDQGLAKDVPPEAHRRFRADLREKQERNRQERAAQLALHEEKKQFIAEWIAANGTEEQKARLAAGVLPMEEAIEAITDEALRPLDGYPRYVRDGAERLRQHLVDLGADRGTPVEPGAIVVTSTNATKASAAQWARIQEIQNRLPQGRVLLRSHRIEHRDRKELPAITTSSAVVILKQGPLTLRREYCLE